LDNFLFRQLLPLVWFVSWKYSDISLPRRTCGLTDMSSYLILSFWNFRLQIQSTPFNVVLQEPLNRNTVGSPYRHDSLPKSSVSGLLAAFRCFLLFFTRAIFNYIFIFQQIALSWYLFINNTLKYLYCLKL
jgi:hypothetical protein